MGVEEWVDLLNPEERSGGEVSEEAGALTAHLVRCVKCVYVYIHVVGKYAILPKKTLLTD